MWLMRKFDNKKRRRHYGVRVGDEVEYEVAGGCLPGVVVELSIMDNNCAYVDIGEKVIPCVAEFLTIKKRVEENNS